MHNPSVSIILSTYNDERFIAQAIQSITEQTFTDWECIIINDASTDMTGSIIKRFAKEDGRIKLFENKTNRGQTENIIQGVRMAKGRYIAKIDGDDIWLQEDKLCKQVNYLNSHDLCGFVGTWGYYIDTDNKKISPIEYPVTDTDIRSYMLIENCFLHSSILIRKEILTNAGGYNPHVPIAQDYELWLRCGLLGDMHNIDEYMIGYRINPKGITLKKYLLQLQATVTFIKEYKKYYPHYMKALILWHMRIFIPRWIRMYISATVRRHIFPMKNPVVTFKKAYA